MSNLGMYQTLTTLSKKMGGPDKLLLAVGGAGYVVLRAGEGLIKVAVKTVKNHNKQKATASSKIYTVYKEGESNEGLLFSVGETFRVLEQDGETVLIEKIGAQNNPYYVSLKLLRTISNYR